MQKVGRRLMGSVFIGNSLLYQILYNNMIPGAETFKEKDKYLKLWDTNLEVGKAAYVRWK